MTQGIKPQREIQEAMVRAYQMGKTAKDAAAIFGLSGNACLEALKRMGIQCKSRGGFHLQDSVYRAMAEDYEGGLSMADVAKKHGHSIPACSTALKRLGVQKRPNGLPNQIPEAEQNLMVEDYLKGASMEDITKKYGRGGGTCSRALHRHNIRLRPPYGNKRTYSLDDAFFDNIDTEEKAYWLGFLTADGCVRRDRVVLALKLDDKKHVEKFALALHANNPVHEYTYSSGGRAVSSAQVCLCSKHLASSLIALGVIVNKSLVVKPCKSIPEALQNHYWRGLFDGDGHVCRNGKYWEIGLVGTREIVQGFSDYLMPFTQSRTKVRKLHNIFRISYGGITEVQEVIKALYRDATVYLDRKKALADIVLTLKAKRVSYAPMRHQVGMINEYKKGRTAEQAAAIYGYSKYACLGALKRHGIPRRKESSPKGVTAA